MTKAQNQDLLVGRVVLGVGMIGMVIVLVLALLPRPSGASLKPKFRRDRAKALFATEEATAKVKVLRARVNGLVWKDDEGYVGGAVLSRVDELVRKHRLNLVSLRPQRANENGTLKQLPYVLNVDGDFAGIVNFTRDLELPTGKLAVNLLQLSASDASAEQVSATIGVLAYLDPTKPAVSRLPKPAKLPPRTSRSTELNVSTSVTPESATKRQGATGSPSATKPGQEARGSEKK